MNIRFPVALLLCLCGCSSAELEMNFVDPGHFHASLVLRKPLEGVSRNVGVYAPEGPELSSFLEAVGRYNGRDLNPTCWKPVVHPDEDLPKRSRRGSGIVVLAGKNSRKTERILDAITKGYNVLSDKPLAINDEDFALLEKAYGLARKKGLVIQELMTERKDELNIRTREILKEKTLAGGSPDAPCIEMESVHHFYKEVDGVPLRRPAWYYDVNEQGEGIADVTTHLVDLLLWQCFPDEAILPEEVELVSASHYPTTISPSQFFRSTGENADGPLQVYSNGTLTFRIRDIFARISVRWDFEGGPDTFQTWYHCVGGDVAVLQNETTGYSKKLFDSGNDITPARTLSHEDHFSLVASDFLAYVRGEKMPEWEVPNTLSKYYLLTKAVEMASHQ